ERPLDRDVIPPGDQPRDRRGSVARDGPDLPEPRAVESSHGDRRSLERNLAGLGSKHELSRESELETNLIAREVGARRQAMREPMRTRPISAHVEDELPLHLLRRSDELDRAVATESKRDQIEIRAKSVRDDGRRLGGALLDEAKNRARLARDVELDVSIVPWKRELRFGKRVLGRCDDEAG